jgi:hypothetical protein
MPVQVVCSCLDDLTPDFPVLAAFVPQASDSSRCQCEGFNLTYALKFMRATGAESINCLLRLIPWTLMLTRRSMMQSNHFLHALADWS